MRLHESMDAAVRHLHAFAREVDLKPQELSEGLRFLAEVGHKCTPHRHEFILLSEVLGLDLRSIRPLGYSTPMDGPVGDLIRAQGRHGMRRPAHVHFLVASAGFKDVTTAFYLRNDKYIDSDTVFGVTESLIREIKDPDPSSPLPDLPSVEFNFTLLTASQSTECDRAGGRS